MRTSTYYLSGIKIIASCIYKIKGVETHCLKGCSWPLAAISGVENYVESIAVNWREAEHHILKLSIA